MGIVSVIEVIGQLVVVASVMYVSLLLCVAASCLVHFWICALKPAKKVWAVLPIGRDERLLMRMDKEIAEILVKCNEV